MDQTLLLIGWKAKLMESSKISPSYWDIASTILFNKVIADEKKIPDNYLVEMNQLYSNMFESTV